MSGGIIGYGEPFTQAPDHLILDTSLTARERFLWIVLQSFTSKDRVRPWPGKPTLAAITGVTERQTHDDLRGLAAAGYLSWEKRPGSSNLYTMRVPRNPASGVTPEAQFRHPRNPSSGEEEPMKNNQTVCVRAPEPAVNPPAAPKVGKVAVSAREEALAGRAIDAFNAAAGTAFTVGAHRTKVVGRIREHPELAGDDHEEIIRRNFAVPWWGEDKPAPSVIYGNASIFERAMHCDGKPRPAAERSRNGRYDKAAESAARYERRKAIAQELIDEKEKARDS